MKERRVFLRSVVNSLEIRKHGRDRGPFGILEVYGHRAGETMVKKAKRLTIFPIRPDASQFKGEKMVRSESCHIVWGFISLCSREDSISEDLEEASSGSFLGEG